MCYKLDLGRYCSRFKKPEKVAVILQHFMLLMLQRAAALDLCKLNRRELLGRWEIVLDGHLLERP